MIHYVLDESDRLSFQQMFPGIILAPGCNHLACGAKLVVWSETTDKTQVTCPDCLKALSSVDSVSSP